jgi:hypothetical protein
MAEAITAMSTVHSESTHFFAATLRNIVEVFRFLNYGLIVMMLTLKNHMIGYFISLIQNFDDFQPNVLLSICFFTFLVIFERSISEALSVSKNVKTLDSSGKSNTYSIACLKESNLVHVIVPHQGQ